MNMKKIISFALVAVMVGMMFSSCKQTPEEKYISDVKDYYKKIEALEEIKLEMLEKIAEMKSEYGNGVVGIVQGFDNGLPLTNEDFNDTKLKLTPDQLQGLDVLKNEYQGLIKKYSNKYYY